MKIVLPLIVIIAALGFVYMQTDSQISPTVVASKEANIGEVASNTDQTSGAELVSGDTTLGGELYDQHCVTCHGTGGASLRGSNIVLERLQFILNDGTAHQPDFTGMFTEEEITNIHAYLTLRENG
jgi:mono/diheme cytochrome c family protein